MAQNICKDWKITNEEYNMLNDKFGDLAEYAAWELFKKNSRNNHTDEQSDIAQELRIALIRAGSYYKRQIYIEACFKICMKYAKDEFIIMLLESLENLWLNKTRHGANRQKFGLYQEELLYKLTKKLVPKSKRPNKDALLKIDTKFTTYCKAITWNAQKSMGKKITREKGIRSGQISISEFDHLI
jgi:hypothetical protein